MNRAWSTGVCLLAVLCCPAAEGAFVSIVNLDTYQGGTPTAEDLAGVTVISGQHARLGVVVELMEGTYESDGTPNANALDSYAIAFGFGTSNPVGTIRLHDTRGLAVNDAGQPWHSTGYSIPMAQWLAHPYESAPPLIHEYFQSGSDFPAFVGIGNTFAGRRVFVLNEIVVQGTACQERSYGVVFDTQSCVFAEGNRPYLYQPDDSHGHGGPNQEFGGYMVQRNGRGAASAFVIRVLPDDADCNANAMADGCEYVTGDCNRDGLLDACEPPGADCDGNGVADVCELSSRDCNANHVHDACEIGSGAQEDCDHNGVPDPCTLADDPDLDCDASGILDVCELTPCGSYCVIESDAVLDPFGHSETWRPSIEHMSADANHLIMAWWSYAYLFAFDGVGWVPETRWDLAQQDTTDDYVASVAIDGDTGVIGALYDDDCIDAPPACVGLAFVLRKDDDAWTTEAVLESPDGVDGRSFGSAVSVSGDTVFVGDPGWTTGGLPAVGAVYVFHRDQQGWSYQERLTSTVQVAGDKFGTALAARGSRLVVGAPGLDVACLPTTPNCNYGGGLVFDQSPDGWQRQAILSVGGVLKVGGSLAFDGDLVVLGEAPVTSGIYEPAHPIPVFRRVDGQWTFESHISPPDPIRHLNFFGGAVAVSGETIVVSRIYYNSINNETFTAYVFRRSPGVSGAWFVDSRLLPAPGTERQYFSHRIAAAGGRVFVSAQGWTSGGGAAYVFDDPTADCDASSHSDRCEIGRHLVPDCNENQTPDSCDVAAGVATDCDHDGTLDVCQYPDGGGGACCTETGCVDVSGVCACAALRFVCDVNSLHDGTGGGVCGLSEAGCCFGDADGNGVVNPGDRGFIAANIGQTAYALLCQYDLDGNGFINAGDRGFVAANIGLCSPLPNYQDGSGLNAAGDGPDGRFAAPVFGGAGTSCGAVGCP